MAAHQNAIVAAQSDKEFNGEEVIADELDYSDFQIAKDKRGGGKLSGGRRRSRGKGRMPKLFRYSIDQAVHLTRDKFLLPQVLH